MRCNNFYRYANLLAVVLLLLSTGLSFGAKNRFRSSTPDTFSPISQVEEMPFVQTLAAKPIENIKIAPRATVLASSSAPLSIKISGRTIPIFATSSLGANPGTRVALYQGQFLFGHSSSAFSVLPYADTFQIRSGNTVENYKIVKKVVYCDYSNLKYGLEYDCRNFSEPRLPARVFGNAADYYEAYAEGYDLILMTCFGAPLGNQDATHRLLAYAVRI